MAAHIIALTGTGETATDEDLFISSLKHTSADYHLLLSVVDIEIVISIFIPPFLPLPLFTQLKL